MYIIIDLKQNLKPFKNHMVIYLFHFKFTINGNKSYTDEHLKYTSEWTSEQKKTRNPQQTRTKWHNLGVFNLNLDQHNKIRVCLTWTLLQNQDTKWNKVCWILSYLYIYYTSSPHTYLHWNLWENYPSPITHFADIFVGTDRVWSKFLDLQLTTSIMSKHLVSSLRILRFWLVWTQYLW